MKSAPTLSARAARARRRGAVAQTPAQHAEIDALVATHAKANAVPEALVHRVIVRESKYQPIWSDAAAPLA